MGPYPKSGRGKSYLLVITDLFSRWVEAFPLGNSKAPQILETLEREVFRRYGYPRSLLTDNGPQFTGRTWIEACQKWSISCWTTLTYHPRANPTERHNQDLKKGMWLRLAVRPHKDWDRDIPEILYNTRTRKNAATGLTPSEVLFGENLKRPGDWTIPKPPAPPDNPRNTRIQQVRQYHARYLDVKAPKAAPKKDPQQYKVETKFMYGITNSQTLKRALTPS